jgi:hypothetical protein
LGGFLTVVLLGGFMLIMFRRDFKHSNDWHDKHQRAVKKVNG